LRVSEEIEKIVYRMMESFMVIDDSTICWLGVDRYKQFQKESYENMRMTTSRDRPHDLNITKYFTMCGAVTIRVNPKLHPEHLSIGRITLMDFFIEDILLGDENIIGDDYNIPGSDFGFYSGSDLPTTKPSK
jgi:hypothetical protein